jgi:hypothetical protein
MSRYDRDDLDRDIARGLVVQEFGPDGVDLLDWLAHTSRADPTEVDG